MDFQIWGALREHFSWKINKKVFIWLQLCWCQKKFQKMPEKTHNLIFFLEQLQISPPEPVGKFIVRLNEASVATRYPESLAIISKNYSQKIAADIINESREALKWIKQQY